MARGFESKSVEEQQLEAKRGAEPRKQLSADEMQGRRKRDGLLLAIKDAERRLAAATNEAHRQMLERALTDLRNQLQNHLR